MPSSQPRKRRDQRQNQARSDGSCDLVLKLVHEHSEVEWFGHPGSPRPALISEGDHGFENLLHPKGRPYLHPHLGRLAPDVYKSVVGVGRNDHGVAGSGHDAAKPLAELQDPPENVEALLLFRMNVATGNAAVGLHLELE
jgi:hypothetical protein